MALAYREPDLVPIIGLAVSVGPIDEVPGAFDRLSAHDQEVVALLRRDDAAGRASIHTAFQLWLDEGGSESLFAESWGESDDQVLAVLGVQEQQPDQQRQHPCQVREWPDNHAARAQPLPVRRRIGEPGRDGLAAHVASPGDLPVATAS